MAVLGGYISFFGKLTFIIPLYFGEPYVPYVTSTRDISHDDHQSPPPY